ncbi:MAG: hypothetical protein ACLR6B_18665 [Blautia sp.]
MKDAFPGYPVDLLNDTACYSYAEKVYGSITEKNFAFINFGNRGIGASLLSMAPCSERPAALSRSSAIIPWIRTVLYASVETTAAWRL